MYRLLNFPRVQLGYFHNVSLNTNEMCSKLNISERTCRLCKQLYIFSGGYVRHRSTITSPNLRAKKPHKKRLKSVKNYAELLVVTDKSTKERKAKVKMLRPDELKLLALTNLNLGELYKLKDMMKQPMVEEHTYNNLTVIENAPETPTESVIANSDVSNDSANVDEPITSIIGSEKELALELTANDIALEHLENIETVNSLNTFHPASVEELYEPLDYKEEPKKVKVIKPVSVKARHEVISRTMAAYMEVCNVLKSPQKGLNVLWRHETTLATNPAIKAPHVYNTLLKGFAATGNLKKIEHIINYARKNGVEPDVQSYAAIFECLGRINHQNNHLKQIRIYTKEASNAGISYDRILNEAIFLNDERDVVFAAMHAHDRNYEVEIADPSVQYCNHLLNGLNNEAQLNPRFTKRGELNSIFSKDGLERKIKQQIDIERTGYVNVRSIEAKEAASDEVIKFRECIDEHVKIWEAMASKAFDRDLSALSAQRHSLNLDSYLRSIPKQDVIKIITDEIKILAQGSETHSATVGQLYKQLGTKFYVRYKVLRKEQSGVLDKILKVHKEYCDSYVDSHGELKVLPEQDKLDYLNSRQKWQWMELRLKSQGASIDLDHQAWVPPVVQAIGKFLYTIIMHDLKIDVNAMRATKNRNFLPAFYTIFRNQGRIISEEVKPHPVLSRLYRASVPETLTFPSYEVPMRCPPVPWCSLNTGGYLVSHCDFVRLPILATSQKQRLKNTVSNELYPSFDSLNQLASVPWRVNTRILDFILKVFNNGGSSKLNVPEPPWSLLPPPAVTPDMDKKEKYMIFRQNLQHRRKKGEMYSLWCDCLYRLSLANHFRDDVFWLPHNMDFRGRVYPIPPHLNHLGSDLARSMLIFAEGRPLGPEGLDWLKLHLVNLTGTKKNASTSDRLVYANEVMDDILDSADNPLGGRMWWAEADEPWQALACCMEIASAVRSPDPTKHVSYFPVHQDGSCNGLQHYAALGRDSAGGYSVNLTPTKTPQDVYSAVAKLVEEKRLEDAKNGVAIAKVLEGCIKRKVIKQTVMTTVYGVTRYGARLQIARQLKDLDGFPKDQIWAASSYLTGRTFDSLRTMFTSTKEIQDWFTECARMISSVCEENVEWVTPLGLPVVQPYFKYKKGTTSNYDHFQMDQYEKPNMMKQKNAFPPNFIHSLDSCHMMLTSLYCERAGITFISVHDCFWTHPSTVHIMNKICREQFVALHSEPILDNLSKFLQMKYSYSTSEFSNDGSVTELSKRKLNAVLARLPKTGDFDIRQVLRSVYFFS